MEKGKPLISRRRMKPKETSQSEVFGAEHKPGGTQRKNPCVEQQIEERKETVGER